MNEAINSSNQITKLHKFTQSTQLVFERVINKISAANKSKTLPNDYISIIESIHRGRVVCRKANCFHVSVSQNLVNRAVCFLDTLAKELESKGFKIQSLQEKSRHFVVAIKDNEHISFQLSEGYKYQPIRKDLKTRSALEKLLYRDREPIPTGKLTFSASASETNIGKNWTDGKKRLIEVELPAIINEFENLVSRQKILRIELVIKDKQRQEEVTIFKEIESKKYAAKTIYDTAMQEAHNFKVQKELESYLNHLETKYIEVHGSLNEAIQSWLLTARQISQSQNPVNKRLKLLSNL